MTNEEVFASTTPGLEPALAREARALCADVRQTKGGVTLRGPKGLHQDANLRLRTASRVLLRVASAPVPVRGLPALQRALAAAPLGAYVAEGAEVALSVHAPGAQLGSD